VEVASEVLRSFPKSHERSLEQSPKNALKMPAPVGVSLGQFFSYNIGTTEYGK
jgi:hypothetical protein